jgi:oxygen-dependent protoporphyrinogen oxidase
MPLEYGAGFRVFVEGDAEPIPADAVVAAGEAFANAELIAAVAPDAAAALREIETPPVAVVALGYPPAAAAAFPTGFGVLIARDQGYRILGCIWDSQLFPGRSPDGHLLVRAMLGGAVDPEAVALDDDALLELVTGELARIFKIGAAPVFSHIARWPRAIPQYDLGHVARVRRIENEVRRVPGLFLAGNALHGVAFAKSAVTGILAGSDAAMWLAGSR